MNMLKNICVLLSSVLLLTVFLSSCTKNKVNDLKDNEQKIEYVNTLGFDNASLLTCVAQCLGKDESLVTQEDIESIRYLAIGPEADGTVTVYVGLVDYVDHALSADATIENLDKYVKRAVIKDVKGLSGDLGKFKNLEIFEFYDFEIEDVSFIKNYHQLIYGYFANNGITDVSPLYDYNPETLNELDFTGNNITDWSPLYNLKEKVIVNYTVENMTDENGNEVQVPFITTLADKLSQNIEKENTQVENQEENSQETGMGQSGVEISQSDWNSLFD